MNGQPTPHPSMVIGVDFDNTLVCYDDVFQRLALEAGFAGSVGFTHQKAVREAARRSPEGDIAWQRLQGQAYGPRIQEAKAFEGALSFLGRCHQAGIHTWVISHKTPFASIDPTQTDLRKAATAWMERNGFFSSTTGLEANRFLFGASRQEKISHIKALGCTHFIDDLAETFLETDFPKEVQGILFSPGETEFPEQLPGIWVTRSWRDLEMRFFHA